MNVMLCNTIQCNQPPFSNLPPGNFKYKLNFGGSSKSVIGFMTQLKEKKVSKAFLDDMCESKKGQLLKRKGLRQKNETSYNAAHFVFHSYYHFNGRPLFFQNQLQWTQTLENQSTVHAALFASVPYIQCQSICARD